ncbi:hypothetical protein GLYMA_13G186801v4 [Glycine max]|nr:hypothetical protein GLYMA_13G186801v4 [Glycine max]KAH1102219.1 hypothetical protein GYH30_036658 [Glycine max]
MLLLVVFFGTIVLVHLCQTSATSLVNLSFLICLHARFSFLIYGAYPKFWECAMQVCFSVVCAHLSKG